MSQPSDSPGSVCPRCNGAGVIYPEPLEVMADKAWAENRPNRYIAAIRDLRIADDSAQHLKVYKDAIDAAKERAGDG